MFGLPNLERMVDSHIFADRRVERARFRSEANLDYRRCGSRVHQRKAFDPEEKVAVPQLRITALGVAPRRELERLPLADRNKALRDHPIGLPSINVAPTALGLL